MTTQLINTNLMDPHDVIQRGIKGARVQKIAREYDPRYLSSFHVVENAGRYLVVDGQHRLAAIKKLQSLNKLSETEVDCYIIAQEIAEDVNELKRYFDKVNEGQKLSQEDKFKVEENAGQEDTLRARDAAESIKYSLTARKLPNTRTLSFGAWKDAFLASEESAKKALNALDSAYTPGGSFSMAVFTSVFEFVNSLQEPLDYNRLVNGLKHVGADELNNKSRGKNRVVNGRKAVQDAYKDAAP